MSDKELNSVVLGGVFKPKIRELEDKAQDMTSYQMFTQMNNVVNSLDKQIAELQEKLKAHEWVSVDDRLPEDGRCLLAVWCDGEYKAYADYEFPRFLSHVDSLYVTHWKPLTPPADKG